MSSNTKVALLAEGVDRNFYDSRDGHLVEDKSPSSRRAWIEILFRILAIISV